MSTTPRPATPFIWYELMTSDHTAAFAFYEHVLGWRADAHHLASDEYTIVQAGPHTAGGMMTLPAEACAHGARPCWMTYLGVADVEATIGRVTAAGGKVVRPPMDIPNVGRFAVLADPDGAAFLVMKPVSDEPMPVIPDDAPGTVGWRELHAGDGPRAMAWYAEQFGWTKADAIDMGPNGIYQLFAAGGQPVGGMMTKMPESPMPFWTFYFNVDGLDAAVERVKSGGGKVLMEQHEVPGPKWISYVEDPQGAMFGMVADRR